MKEEWRPVVGWEGEYEISNKGRLKSNGKLISLSKDGSGYFRHKLQRNLITQNATIHRLVAQSFIPNKHKKPQVSHINDIKTDNRVENLVWATRAENMKQAHINNRFIRGTQQFSSKLNENKVKTIIKLLNSSWSSASIARRYGVSTTVVYKIKFNKLWKHVPRKD